MQLQWIHSVLAGLTGAAGVKVLDVAYQEYRDRRKSRADDEEILVRHQDPILKAAVELVGKIRALAQHDFSDLLQISQAAQSEDGLMEVLNVLFLHGQFWARIQILRQESVSINLGKTVAGKHLRAFFETLESRGVRIEDRGFQRGMGEALISGSTDALRSINFYEFVDRYLSSPQFRSWYEPFRQRLVRLTPDDRQQLLVHGTVIHAMIDTLDPTHLVDRERLGYPNKLRKKARNILRYQVFGKYLDFVTDAAKYTGRE